MRVWRGDGIVGMALPPWAAGPAGRVADAVVAPALCAAGCSAASRHPTAEQDGEGSGEEEVSC